MPTFSDPVTNTRYDPIGDPSGFLMKMVGIVVGLTLTALAASIALRQALPWTQGQLSQLSGGVVGDTGGAWEGW